MRGLLLITVAVILIVLGLRQSGSDTDPVRTNRTELTDKTAEGEQVPTLNDPGTAMGAPELPDMEPLASGPVEAGVLPELEAGTELPFVISEGPEPLGSNAGSGPRASDSGGKPVAPWGSPTDGVSIQEASSQRVELGPPGGEGSLVAEALLNAWIEQDSDVLQVVLDGDHGSKAAQAQARLAGLFWQAMVGRPEMGKEAWSELESSGSTTPAQMEMLRAAIDFDAAPNVPEHAGRRDPLARSMRMVLLDTAAGRYQDSSRSDDAARSLSELILSEVHAPWKPHRKALAQWAERINLAQDAHRMHPRGDWPALTVHVQRNDTMELIRGKLVRENHGLQMCTGLIEKVNHVGRYIHPEQVLRVPTDPCSMLVDLNARIALYRHGGEVVRAYVVGIGREGKPTPVGTFTVGEKLEEPAWTRRGKATLPYGHPENLLGERWMGWYLDGTKTDYGFHGTNDETGVGEKVSSGCIRMRNADVTELYELLPVGSQVIVQP